MQYIIPATFVDENWFKAGLTPTINIRQRDDVNLMYIDKVTATMSDTWLWDYVYIFIDYDKTKLYTYKIDWWSDELSSRYITGNNELDYFSNKDDFWGQFKWVIGWFSDWLYRELKILKEILEEYKPKEIDLSTILNILEEIKTKEYPDNYEIIEKLEDKSDKMEIISTIKSNEANLLKTNNENWQLINKLLVQVNSDREIIKKLENYIEKLIKRWDIEKDSDFRKLVKNIKEWEEIVKEWVLEQDEDFISLIKL